MKYVFTGLLKLMSLVLVSRDKANNSYTTFIVLYFFSIKYYLLNECKLIPKLFYEYILKTLNIPFHLIVNYICFSSTC